MLKAVFHSNVIIGSDGMPLIDEAETPCRLTRRSVLERGTLVAPEHLGPTCGPPLMPAA